MGGEQPPAAADVQAYLAQVKPLLRSRCYACHGALKQKAALRLDTAAAILKGGDSGPALVKGNVDESLLIERVSARDVSERMPPEHEGESLNAEQVGQLRAWIAAGAPAPADERPEPDPREHWAFRPVARPETPRLEQAGWARNPIDAFIARGHEQSGIRPAPEATRLELLRRLGFDLIGLPPTPEEIDAFLADQRPDWYERAVERLLSSPRHGERWGRHWMDVWRYSDWWGLGAQLRNSQKHIWHWRDWIIESLNADAPYDEMVRLMLAADEIRPNDPSALRATGFLARNYFLFNRNQWMDETVEHVGKAFLGLTLNCAKCHDHKYDPIGQPEYYKLRAIFEPYHVRVDAVPGEADLDRDGIPRAFDGALDAPTYRFVRGQENNPDKSSVVTPGIPELLAFAGLNVQPVDLPPEAWQPERHPWVIEAQRAAAGRKVAEAEAKLGPAREKVEAARGEKAAEARLELQVAERGVEAARAELRSVEERATAMRLSWDRSNPADGAGADPQIQAAARTAARREREANAARARLALAEAESRLGRAASEKKDAANKEVASARAAVEKAEKAIGESSEQFTRFTGAQWTPTRFFNSSKDDPEVKFPPRSTGRRRALAEWITDRRNPLAARVAVNHIWARHMGTPLVATVFEFGRKGSPPSNRALLDWLAAEFVESGWSMKHLHRLIVESATYRLSSSSNGADRALAHDPENTRYWRRSTMRLESQAVRDAILFLNPFQDGRMGGPPVLPADQSGSRRRSLYFFHSNNDRNLFLTMFDEALVKECYRREQSIVPQQALAMSNSALVLGAAEPIARRLGQRLAAVGDFNDDRAFIRLAFTVLLGAEPSAPEIAASLRALESWRSLPEARRPLEGDPIDWPRGQLVWVLLNHNDFVTLR